MKTGSILSALLIGAASLAVLMFTAPFAAPYGAYAHIGGAIGIMDGQWELSFPDVMYALGDMVCHQQWERSVILNGSQMPLCTRCTFAAIGIAAGALIPLLHRDIGGKAALIAGTALLSVTAADWMIQASLGTAFIPSLAVTGAAGGIGLSLLLYWYLEYGNGDK